MPHPLESIRVKIQRAKEQIVNLDAEIREFREKTYFFTFEDDPLSNRRHYRLHIEPSEVDGFNRISVLTGEIIHHLRSCFDHLIEQLILKAGNTPNKSHQFPVFLVSGDYVKEAKRRIKGVVEGSAVLIEKLQPYNGRGKDDHLSILHSFDIVDKHRLLLVINRTVNSSLYDFRALDPSNPASPAQSVLIRGGSRYGLQNGAIFETLSESEMDMDVYLSVDVVLDEARDWREQSIVKCLSDLVDFTESKINEFSIFF